LSSSTPSLTLTLTFVDVRQLGAIKVLKTGKDKSCTAVAGTCVAVGSRALAGASFTVGSTTQSTGSDGTTCFGGLAKGSSVTVTENSAPTGYAIDDTDPGTTGYQTSKSVTVTNAGTCSGTTNNVTFTDTPYSSIEVKFNSTAGAGVTVASIVCAKGASTIAADSENGGGDPALDDTDETFSSLLPGTYTCTVVVDP